MLYLALKHVKRDHGRDGHEQPKRRGNQGLEHAPHHRVGVPPSELVAVRSWAALIMPNTVPSSPT